MNVFKTEKGRRLVFAQYDRLLAAWGVDFKERDLEGSFGSTHVIEAGDPSNPALLLFHGVGDNSALMWLYNAKALSDHYRIIAVDTMGGAGKSQPGPGYGRGFSLKKWLGEVQDALGVERVYAAGVSYGCYMVQLLASAFPDRVMGILGISGALYCAGARKASNRRLLAVFLPALLFPFGKNGGKARLLNALTGPKREILFRDEELFAHWNTLFSAYRGPMAQRFHDRKELNDAEIASFREKALFLIGEADELYFARAPLDFAEHGISYRMIAGVGHTLNHEEPEIADQAIIDMLGGAQSPARIGKMAVADLLGRKEFMMYDVEDVHAIHYAEACAAYGALKFSGLVHDGYAIRQLANRYSADVVKALPNTANHVDANVYGILPLELYLQTNETSYRADGLELADIQWDNPLPDGMTRQTRYWIDDVYMIAVLQVQAFRVSQDERYLERAAVEAAAYLAKLQEPNGLFHHGEQARFFWGRGNGWVAAGLAELLGVLPASARQYPAIRDGFCKMMYALKGYQCADGMWRQLVDNQNAWKESSATAMFAFATASGVRQGILEKNDFTDCYQKAWLALCAQVQEDGKLDGICTGTGQSADVSYYLNRPTVSGDLHGQAPLLWLASELLQL